MPIFSGWGNSHSLTGWAAMTGLPPWTRHWTIFSYADFLLVYFLSLGFCGLAYQDRRT